MLLRIPPALAGLANRRLGRWTAAPRVRRRAAQGIQPMERRLTNGLVSVVLVTWNSAPFLRRCLAALAAQTYPTIELIHVDNASADDSRRHRPRAAPTRGTSSMIRTAASAPR